MQGTGFNYSQMHPQHTNNVISLWIHWVCSFGLVRLRSHLSGPNKWGNTRKKSQTVTQQTVNNLSEVICLLQNSCTIKLNRSMAVYPPVSVTESEEKVNMGSWCHTLWSLSLCDSHEFEKFKFMEKSFFFKVVTLI